MAVKSGTSIDYVFELAPGETPVDFTSANHVYVTFSQLDKRIVKKDSDLTVTETSIKASLSQQETLRFKGVVEIEINLTFDNGGRAISDTLTDEYEAAVEDKVLT